MTARGSRRSSATRSNRGGKLIIPAFALGRVEELLYWIHQLEDAKRIPVLPVYVDSPMAAAVLAGRIAARLDELDVEIGPDRPMPRTAHCERNVCAFCTLALKVVSSIAESRAVQDSSQSSIVISSSGMATGGRVLHHLARALPEPQNTVLFAGFQAAGTRGRRCATARSSRASTASTSPVARADRAHRFDVRARRRGRDHALAGGFHDAAGADVPRPRRARGRWTRSRRASSGSSTGRSRRPDVTREDGLRPE